MLIGKRQLGRIFKHSGYVKKQNTLHREKNLGVVLDGVLIKILSGSVFHNVISMNFVIKIKGCFSFKWERNFSMNLNSKDMHFLVIFFSIFFLFWHV